MSRMALTSIALGIAAAFGRDAGEAGAEGDGSFERTNSCNSSFNLFLNSYFSLLALLPETKKSRRGIPAPGGFGLMV